MDFQDHRAAHIRDAVAGHAHHSKAWAWWQQRPDATVGLCLLTRMGVLRLLTNARVMNAAPISPEKALAAWETLAVDTRCLWLEADPAHESFFRRFLAGRQSSPNLWTDAWLAALASAGGFHLTSFDAGFRSFGLADFELLTT